MGLEYIAHFNPDVESDQGPSTGPSKDMKGNRLFGGECEEGPGKQGVRDEVVEENDIDNLHHNPQQGSQLRVE